MNLVRFFLGRRGDWHVARPRRRRIRPQLAWLGPIIVFATSLVGWYAFAGQVIDPNRPDPAFSLWSGSVSILLMAWSFILAVRLRFLEPLFGGLDSMYRVHRWAGALSVGAMVLHTSNEPLMKGLMWPAGASASVANAAEDLAETGETMLYVLIALSVLRMVPYRWWRWTHKLFGIPFAFASWHMYTAMKPFENNSPWGWWFAGFMIAGLVAWLVRVIGRDVVSRGRRYRVVAAEHVGSTTRLELEPVGRPLRFDAGQFAFLKLDVPGLREPHPFTIASPPESTNLEFMVRHLGDWSNRLPDADLAGRTVTVEGPYGEFDPGGGHGPAVWIAGGVGITPFLSAMQSAPPPNAAPPTLLYAVRSTTDNPMLDRVLAAEADGRVRLHLFTPDTGRMSPVDLDRIFPDGLAGHHVALCGPDGLIRTMSDAALARGAKSAEVEDFDIRQGFGPDRSAEIDARARRLLSSIRS